MRLAFMFLGAALMAAGCGEPAIGEGQFACGPAEECPSDWFCHSDGLCYSSRETVDPIDAGDDAGPVDGGVQDAGPTDGGGRDGGPGDGGSDAGADAGPSCPPSTMPVDILLIIDDSGSLSQEQATFVAAFPELVRTLGTGDRNDDGTPEFHPALDVRVGVVTTDMGTGGHPVPGCTPPDFGDDGVLRTQGNTSLSGCMATYPAFLEFGAGDSIAEFGDDHACVATVGTEGCGFEQPLEAGLKALTPGTSPIRFHGATAGHGDGRNAGFLRSDSILIMALVTDEDDCSASDVDLFDPMSSMYPGGLTNRCVIWESAALHGIGRYASGFPAFRPGAAERLVFGVLAGIPLRLEGFDYTTVLDDPGMGIVFEAGSVQRPSCSDAGRGTAFPPRRIVQATQQLDLLGANTALRSICQDDYSSFMNDLVLRALPILGSCE